MLDKIKSNINNIISIASIVAIALVTPQLFDYVFEAQDNMIYEVVYIGGLIIANVLAFLMAYKNKTALLNIIVVVFLGVHILSYLETVISNDSYYNIPYLALYGVALVVYLISLGNDKVNKLLLVLLLICLCFAALGALSGGAVSLSCTITLLIIMSQLYITK
ncbi:MAG: hypothetical protein IJY14_03765 [Acholeplasmatales bacterium]|nr:hypothetical protein [Acholeplasmatales bacterium]